MSGSKETWATFPVYCYGHLTLQQSLAGDPFMSYAKMRLPTLFSAFCLPGLVVLFGCGNTVAPPHVLTPGGATYLYVIQNGTSLLQFSLTGISTRPTPTATITAPSGTTFSSVTTDSSGVLYVGAFLRANNQGEILVYAAGSTGAATPTRIITGSVYPAPTTFGVPNFIDINSAGTLAVLSYAGNGYSVATMPSNSTGAVTPTTVILGGVTQLTGALGVTIDQLGKVYVTNFFGTGSVLTFAAGATGDTAPTTVITTGGAEPYGIAVDASGNIFTILDVPSLTSAATLAVYAPGASGAATPIRTIAGNLTGIGFGGGVELDSVGNVYIDNVTEAGENIVAFSQSESGNVTPGLAFTIWPPLESYGAEIAVR
jgi:hypothetical protein